MTSWSALREMWRSTLRDELEDEIRWHAEMLAREEREYLAGVVVPQPFRVALTCGCVPEQWDIFHGDRMVGYVRCRHSRWSLTYGDVGGERLIDEPWHPERGPCESNFDDERPAVFERVFAALTARMKVGE